MINFSFEKDQSNGFDFFYICFLYGKFSKVKSKLNYQTSGDKSYFPGSFDKSPTLDNHLNIVIWKYHTKEASSQKTQGPKSPQFYQPAKTDVIVKFLTAFLLGTHNFTKCTWWDCPYLALCTKFIVTSSVNQCVSLRRRK
jgi:hypothetical protein